MGNDNTILLELDTEIPARERWVFENPKILARLKQGIKEAEEGPLVSLGDFSQYIDLKMKNEHNFQIFY